METITKEERKYIHDNCIWTHKSPAGFKIVDIAKAAEYTRTRIEHRGESNIKELVPIHPHKYKTPNYGFTVAKDKEFGVLYGLYTKDDDKGNPLYQRIGISDGKTLNLDQESDLRIWTVLRMWSKIEGSPYESIEPAFRLYDEVSEATQELYFIEQMNKAMTRANEIIEDPGKIVNFLRHCGENLSLAANMKIIKAKLMTKARMYPIEFNKNWADDNRVYSELFESGLNSTVIEHHLDSGYKYGDIGLGLSKEEAMLYMKEHEDVFSSIKYRVEEADTVLKKISDDEEKEKKRNAAKASSHKNQEKEAVKEKEKFNL